MTPSRHHCHTPWSSDIAPEHTFAHCTKKALYAHFTCAVWRRATLRAEDEQDRITTGPEPSAYISHQLTSNHELGLQFTVCSVRVMLRSCTLRTMCVRRLDCVLPALQLRGITCVEII